MVKQKLTHRLLAIICCLSLAIGAAGVTSFSSFGGGATKASAAEGDPVTAAYIVYEAAGIWDAGHEQATDAVVQGYGNYSASINLDTPVSGTGFFALVVVNGHTLYPLSRFRIWSVKINGEDVTVGKGYTADENGTRYTFNNPYWSGDMPGGDPRSYDDNLSNVAYMNLIDSAVMVDVTSIEIDFAFVGPTSDGSEFGGDPATAYIATNLGGNWDPGGANATDADIRGYGNYSVSLFFDAPITTPVEFLAVQIPNGEDIYPFARIRIWSIRINGVNKSLNKGYTCAENANTRYTIYNMYWNIEDGQIQGGEPRSYDNDLSDAAFNILNPLDLLNVESIEIEFAFVGPTSSADYAWLAVQNGWDGPTNPNNLETYDAAVVAKVTGAGEYFVSAAFNTLKTNINQITLVFGRLAKTFPGAMVNIKSVKIDNKVDGSTKEEVLSEPYNDYAGSPDDGWLGTEGETIPGWRFGLANQWNNTPVQALLPVTVDSQAGVYFTDMTDLRYIECTFEFVPRGSGEPVEAYLEYMDYTSDGYYTLEEAGKTDGMNTAGVIADTATISDPGTFTVGLDFSEADYVAQGVSEMKIRIDDGETHYQGWKITVQNITINAGTAEEIVIDEFSNSITYGEKGYFDPAGDPIEDNDMITDIYNRVTFPKISGERANTGLIKDASHNIVSDADTDLETGKFYDIVTIEVTFKFDLANPVAPVNINWNDHFVNTTHNFYMYMQEMTSFVFRNEWSEGSFGKYGSDGRHVADDPTSEKESVFGYLYQTPEAGVNQGKILGGTFTDVNDAALVASDAGGEDYTVSMELGDDDLGFETIEGFNIIGVSTDIYFEAYNQGFILISDVSVKIDGNDVGLENWNVRAIGDSRADKENPDQLPMNPGEFQYLAIDICGEYNDALKGGWQPAALSESIEISFTISYINPDAVNKTNLNALIATVEDLDEDAYTEASWAGITGPLQDAKDVSEDTSATQGEVDDALLALNTAFEALVAKPVDKTALQALVDTVDALELVEDDYTTASWDAFDSQLERAEIILNNASATQADVNDVLSDLGDAVAGLEAVPADKTDLEAAIGDAEDLVESEYTAASWAELETALGTAETVFADADALQSEVDAALDALEGAIEDLVVIPVDKTDLEAAIGDAEDLVESEYTAASWAELETALGAAETVFEDADATQGEVDAALAGLEDAIEGLEEKSASKSGCGSSASAAGMLPLLLLPLLGAALIMAKKQKRGI